MSWFDSVTSLFSTEENTVPIDQPVSQSPQFTPIAPANTLLSPSFSISALSQTTKPLMTPNLPTTEDQLYNMSVLAKTLESLKSIIGNFSIISGFRTKELQQLLASSGEPVAAGVSFHELGLGVDIYPTTMSIDEFFGRLLSDEVLKAQFAEIAIKPKQNSIHLAVNHPDNMREPKILGLNNDNVYGRLSLDDIANYIAPYMASIDEAYDYAAAKLVTYNRTPLYLGMGVAILGIGYLLMNSQKSRGSLRLNPYFGKRWNFKNDKYRIDTWFERDRKYVGLWNDNNDSIVVEWWDADVDEAIEDGFLNPKNWLKSALEYANSRGLITSQTRATKRQK